MCVGDLCAAAENYFFDAVRPYAGAPTVKCSREIDLKSDAVSAEPLSEFSVICGEVVLAAASCFPGVAEHGTTRLSASKATESSKDPTTITRLAEMKDQYDQITSSPDALLFGEGYGQYYRYSPAYLPDQAGQINKKGFYPIWRAVAPNTLYLPVKGRAILMVAALPAASIGGNPLDPRFAGLIFNVASG